MRQLENGEPLEERDLAPALEAILMVAVDPVHPAALSEATGCELALVEETLHNLRRDYDGGDGSVRRGFELREVGGAWRLYSRPTWAPWVGKFVLGDHMATLSQAALETLAVIAYKQPVTRSQVGAVRGVSVDGVVRTLVARGLVEESGETAAGAGLLRTTTLFLEKMGLSSLGELPPLGPHVAGPSEAVQIASELQDQLMGADASAAAIDR